MCEWGACDAVGDTVGSQSIHRAARAAPRGNWVKFPRHTRAAGRLAEHLKPLYYPSKYYLAKQTYTNSISFYREKGHTCSQFRGSLGVTSIDLDF